MVLSAFLLLLSLTGLLLLWVWGHPTSRGHLPPGPPPLPFLGNILQIDHKDLLKSFQKLREKYGNVFTLYLEPRPTIILCWFEAIQEALDQAEAFSGEHIAILDPIFQGTGVAFASGKPWKVLCQFSVATMKDFGMGKQSIEERIREEAKCLVEELRKTQGAYLDPTILFHSITVNIICSIIFGECFDYQDPKFLRLLHLLNNVFALVSSFYGQVFELFSAILKHFPGTYTRLYSIMEELKDFITENIEKHQKALDPSAPQDFIDSFLLCMDKERSVPESEFHRKNLIHTILSLFFAGTETSSTTLCYGLLFLLKNPDVLEKVHAEINRMIGAHRLPAIEDRAKMPYTNAVIHEIHRYSDLTPIGFPHCVLRDTYFRGYLIPKGTTVYPVMNSVLHDLATSWMRMATSGSRSLYPILQKHQCIGESIARSKLFIFLTTMLQNFSLGRAPEDIDLTPWENGLGKLPPVCQLCLLPLCGEGEGK
ncbi:LOW QUALITY PROTEIN: cytochrome P450 2B11-like [Trichechus inunguis]